MTSRRRQFSPFSEHAYSPVEYATVKATVANLTDAAVLLSNDAVPMAVWVPRQALDGASRALLYRTTRGQEVELRIELKMALSKGLV